MILIIKYVHPTAVQTNKTKMIVTVFQQTPPWGHLFRSFAHTNPFLISHFSGNECECPDSVEPVCGKDGVTYGNACLANCAEVAILSAKACPTHTEALDVWQLFVAGPDSSVSELTPDFSLTKKTVTGPTITEYEFTFTNKCVATIVYSSETKNAQLKSHSCPTDECIDDVEMAASFASSQQMTDARFVLFISSK